MTDYKEEADKIIESFRDILPWGSMTETQYEKLCTKCAILSQQRVVDELEYLKIKSTACNASDIFAGRLEYHQNLLVELQSRL